MRRQRASRPSVTQRQGTCLVREVNGQLGYCCHLARLRLTNARFKRAVRKFAEFNFLAYRIVYACARDINA